MMPRGGTRRPKGFGLFDVGPQNVAAPKEAANTMPVLKDELRQNWQGSPELEKAMTERNLRFKKNGCMRVEIGRGAFAKAYLAENTATESEFVIKEVELSTLKEEQRKKAGLEVTFLKSLNHVNVIRCVDAFNTANVLHIVLEYASKGTLASAIDAKKAENTTFTPAEVLRWLAQLTSALRHLHGSRVLHRDLKTANVFLDSALRVKLGDFGLSRKLEDDENFSGHMVGTPYYFAPEVVKSKPFSNKTDVWSAGVIAYEIAFLKKPFQAKSMKGLYKKIAEVNYEALPETADVRVARIITSILLLEPHERPSATKLCHDVDLREYAVGDKSQMTPAKRPSVTPIATPESTALPPEKPTSGKKKSKAVMKMLMSVADLAPPAPKDEVKQDGIMSPVKLSSPLALPAAVSPSKGVVNGGANGACDTSSHEAEEDYNDDFEDEADTDFEDASDEDCDYEDDFESYDDSLIALQ